eukprot:14638292-Heterocapsa_arctica.AAC.1
MALLLEEVPEQLATEAERCPCHGALTRRLSLYRAKGMFGKHYGSRATTCPMAGKNMPELVAGVLDDVFAEVWTTRESVLHQLPAHGQAPLTA